MNAVDTNVLVYLHDPRDRNKQAAAAALVSSLTDGVLIWQVACEYVAAARKLKALGVTNDEIWRNLRLLQSSGRWYCPTPHIWIERNRCCYVTALPSGTPCSSPWQ